MSDTLLVRARQTRWTPERERVLAEAWLRNDHASAIADVLEVTVTAIFSKARLLGLSPRHSVEWAAADVATLKRLWSEGYSAGRIASEMERSRSAICGKVDRLNLPARPLRHFAGVRQISAPKPAVVSIPWAGARNIPLVDLQTDECRFSYSDDAPFLFCGMPTPKGSSWCSHCTLRVFAGR
jgi:hypothetical protein